MDVFVQYQNGEVVFWFFVRHVYVMISCCSGAWIDYLICDFYMSSWTAQASDCLFLAVLPSSATFFKPYKATLCIFANRTSPTPALHLPDIKCLVELNSIFENYLSFGTLSSTSAA